MTLYCRPSPTSEDLEERRLGILFYSYLNPNRVSFNQDFKTWIDQHCPPKQNMSATKEELLSLTCRITDNTHPLYRRLRSYSAPSPENSCYDPEFTRLYNEKFPPIQGPASVEYKKQALLALGRRPQIEEKLLHSALSRFTSPTHPQFDPEFTKLFKESFEPKRGTTTESRRKRHELITLGHRVQKSDPLYIAYKNYMRTDPEFAKLYNETYPSKRTPWRVTFIQCREWAEYHKKFPSSLAELPEERRLGQALPVLKKKHEEVRQWANSHPEWKNKGGHK